MDALRSISKAIAGYTRGCIGSKIRSKWGEFPVYEHPLWEIPIRYGDRLRCYEMPSNAMELFTTYAHMRGI